MIVLTNFLRLLPRRDQLPRPVRVGRFKFAAFIRGNEVPTNGSSVHSCSAALAIRQPSASKESVSRSPMRKMYVIECLSPRDGTNLNALEF